MPPRNQATSVASRSLKYGVVLVAMVSVITIVLPDFQYHDTRCTMNMDARYTRFDRLSIWKNSMFHEYEWIEQCHGNIARTSGPIRKKRHGSGSSRRPLPSTRPSAPTPRP